MSKSRIDDILARKKPKKRTVWIALDGDLVDEISRLEKDIAIEERVDNREHRTPVAPRLRAELDQLRADRDKAAVPFTFTALPKERLPPTDRRQPGPRGQPAVERGHIRTCPHRRLRL